MNEWVKLKQEELDEIRKIGEKAILAPFDEFAKSSNLMHETTIESFTNVSPINHFEYKKIIFNNPATIILWKDGSKTVVKCQTQNGDVYDPEKGIALCFMKKALGNTSRAFNNILNKEVDRFVKDTAKKIFEDACNELADEIANEFLEEKERFDNDN